MKVYITAWVLLLFCNKFILVDGFQWSYYQQANHVINVVLGSDVSLPCDYVLTPQEQQEADIFHLLTWTREQPFNSDNWAGLAVKSTLTGSKVIYDDPQRIFIMNNTLEVTNASVEDHTRYQCAFQSSFFSSPSTIELNVQYKPTETQLSSSVEPVLEGTPLLITCTARANPSAEYKFYRDGQLVSSSSTGVLTFVSLKNEDQGTYRCVPYNQLGEGPGASLTVTIEDEEKFPVWAYGAIGGFVLLVVLIAVLIAFCRTRKQHNSDNSGNRAGSKTARHGDTTANHIGPSFYGEQINGRWEIGNLNAALSYSDVRLSREIPVALKGALSANDVRLAENGTIQDAYPTRSVIELIDAKSGMDSKV